MRIPFSMSRTFFPLCHNFKEKFLIPLTYFTMIPFKVTTFFIFMRPVPAPKVSSTMILLTR